MICSLTIRLDLHPSRASLTCSPIPELILTVMGGLHEFERKLIRQRCDEGIKRATAKGSECDDSNRLPVSS
jgi:DNA invertase Pin-like site-specific DNA recombinase